MTHIPRPLPSRRAVLAGAGALAGAATLPEAIPPAAAQGRRRITIAMPVGPRVLEPVREVSNVIFRTAYNVFDTLIAVDFRDNARLKPGLATAWRRSEPRVLELDLRPGVRFHNGDLLSAEDVAFSFGAERVADPKAPGHALSRPFLGTIERVEAIGPLQVRVVTTAPDPLIEQRLAGWAGQIVSKRAFLAAPSFEAWEKAPVGTGPFAVQDFRLDDRLVLKAHDAYFGGAPLVQELVFRVVPELASRLNALATGEADIITEVSPDQFATIEAMAGREIVGGPIQNIRVLAFDKTHPVLADLRIRQALALAIDRKAIVEALYGGRTTIPPGHQNPAYGPLFMPDYPAPGFDPERARALVRAAGYKGEPIPYRILPNYYTLQLQTAQLLVEMWRQVGLNVEMIVRENPAAITVPAEGRGIRDWSNTIFWNDPAGVLSRLFGPNGPVQRVTKEWSNEEFNRHAGVLATSLDPAERRAAFRRMLEIWDHEDPAGTVLHDLTMFYGKRKDIAWQPYPIEYMDFRAANMG
ncbi:ABC transporter substrate-binding protein [Rhabdaerophilum calidifontis]|uniref:ABC transporter substrate-binding protein n=1 Tax=Rhabdaerophilum calidifontis TaxID=2604328 RepID=UPI0012383E60|nr:ABC transporter substrate-binding protein [Rhabdaerophilum calidifontis]